MQSLVQARRNNSSAGEPLQCPHPQLAGEGMLFRRGNLTLVAAGPGTGKSALVQHWLQVGDRRGNVNSTLYFSSDSDAGTMHIRAAAIATGWATEDIERVIRDGGAQKVDQVVAEATPHMVFQYESSPDEESIVNEVDAYATVYGAYPQAMVFDNLKNVYMPEGDEYRALEDALVFLQGLAKDTNAAIIVPHHVAGAFNDGLTPIPLSGIRGQVTKTPELCLTLHRQGSFHLNVAAVKNRQGKADPSGKTFITIPADLGRMAFG